MNINKLNQGLGDNTQSAKSKSATQEPSNVTKSSTEAQNVPSPQDQVNLSSSSLSIQQIESDIKSMPEINDATIDRVRNAIAEGEYKVDYQRLAGKMLQFDQLLK